MTVQKSLVNLETTKPARKVQASSVAAAIAALLTPILLGMLPPDTVGSEDMQQALIVVITSVVAGASALWAGYQSKSRLRDITPAADPHTTGLR